MSELADDMERLGDIGDRVLAGEPIESFGLSSIERHFVLGYTRRAVENYMGPVDAASARPPGVPEGGE